MSHKHYTHLSYEERVLIEDWNNDTSEDKKSLCQFAKHLGRNPGTISRELSRNGRLPTISKTRVNKPRADGRNYRGTKKAELIKERKRRYEKRYKAFVQQTKIHYAAKAAKKAALLRAKRPGLKLEQPENEELLSFILTALDSRWSPEQITGRIKIEGLFSGISHQAIYDFIYSHEKELGLKRCLRRKGKKYRKQKPLTYNQTTGRKSIEERPEEVTKLSRIGDLEGDTIVGKDKSDRLLTHNDRLSGKVAISRNLGFTAKRISQQSVNDIKRVFTEGCHTITYDNGVEHSCWYETEAKLGAAIYFAHPYRSSERGRNENLNGLIRDFLPKGTDFKTISDDDILMIESLLNNRPRKRLGWLTPNEYYASYTQNTSVALGG